MQRESLIQVYFNRRMAVLVGLGFASGLPSAWALLGSPLQLWLGSYGYDVKTLGMLSLLGTPFAFNFAWAPLLDRYPPPIFRRFGRRRGWLLLIQLLLVGAIAMLARLGPTFSNVDLTGFLIAGLVIATLAATQDVLVDAYRTEILPDAELGAGAAVFVNGYRAAMFVAAGGAIVLSKHLGWPAVYALLACLMAIGIIATLAAPMPPDVAAPTTLAQAVVNPVREFFGRHGVVALAILAFAILFKLPDSTARVMVAPLLQHLKFDMAAIGWVQGTLGIAMTVLGAFAGGAVVARAGVWGSLWILGLLQVISNFGFVALALTGKDIGLLATVVAIEGFCGGMVTAGFIAFLMSQCHRRYTATQYALFTSLNYFTGALVGATTGFQVEKIGYVWFFVLTAVVGLPGLALLIFIPRKPRVGMK